MRPQTGKLWWLADPQITSLLLSPPSTPFNLYSQIFFGPSVLFLSPYFPYKRYGCFVISTFMFSDIHSHFLTLFQCFCTLCADSIWLAFTPSHLCGLRWRLECLVPLSKVRLPLNIKISVFWPFFQFFAPSLVFPVLYGSVCSFSLADSQASETL